MGSPFVSTPVPYVVTPADWLAASIAQRNASILMQHAHLLQTMAQQARPGQIGYMPAPSALVNAMGCNSIQLQLVETNSDRLIIHSTVSARQSAHADTSPA
jgi:hypothetical protein